MPLRDHAYPPVSETHSWDELHGQWPGELVRHLATILPPGFRAAPRIHLGSSFEVDIGTFEKDRPNGTTPRTDAEGSAVALAPAPTLIVDADLSDEDEYEVRIYDAAHGRTLVAAIEIVSPANKARLTARDLFVSKVLALLRQDVCVAIVDPVSERTANLYAELLARLDRSDPALDAPPSALYAVALQGRKLLHGPSQLAAWYYPMHVGKPLPTLPIWLSPDLRVLLPLETSYEEACRVLGVA